MKLSMERMNTHFDKDTSRQETYFPYPYSTLGLIHLIPASNIRLKSIYTHQSKITFCIKWPYFGLKHIEMIQCT